MLLVPCCHLKVEDLLVPSLNAIPVISRKVRLTFSSGCVMALVSVTYSSLVEDFTRGSETSSPSEPLRTLDERVLSPAFSFVKIMTLSLGLFIIKVLLDSSGT